jgi:hypothetical protein
MLGEAETLQVFSSLVWGPWFFLFLYIFVSLSHTKAFFYQKQTVVIPGKQLASRQ